MSASQAIKHNPVRLIKTALATIISNPVILYPFCVIAFIQFLVLEIIFFAPRLPLSRFFEPIIKYWFGEIYLHYPYSYFVIVSWFQSRPLQYSIYILFSSFFFGAAVYIINEINSEKKISLKTVYKDTLHNYIHLIITSLFIVCTLIMATSVNSMIIERAQKIRSEEGMLFWLKTVVLTGAPYINLIIAVTVTTIFAFMIPIIVIERKRVFTALVLNFKHLIKSFWLVFLLNLLPVLLYVPIVLLKLNTKLFEIYLPPEASIVLIVVSICVTLTIDVIQFTAVTIFYLVKREK